MKKLILIALILTSITSYVVLTKEKETACFCDACVSTNYEADPNGIEYATEGK